MKKLKASFTIEAAIIVPLSMFIVISFLYLAFYLHDRVILSTVGANYILENAAANSSLSVIEEDTKEMLENRLIIAEDVCVNVQGDDGITLESSAYLSFPFQFLKDIAGLTSGTLEESINISMLNSRETLLKYKAISDGTDILTGDE